MAQKREKLIIWGAGGHAAVVADIVRLDRTRELVGFVDDTGREARSAFLELRVLRTREALAAMQQKGVREAIIAVGDCGARLRLAKAAKQMGFRLGLAIHPRAVVASSAKLGMGTVVAAGAVINPRAIVGENVIVNTCASVDHDCVVQDGAHICPGAHLAGNVKVGRGAWVGIGATVIDGITIGDGAFIAAGSVVVRDIPPAATAMGVPAKVVRSRTRSAEI
jgi:acetyltransferase EpsM